MRSRISVALCTHNGAAYISEQMRSICNQTQLPDEIVLSDDASSDVSVAMALAAIAEHALSGRPELRVLRNVSPIGVAANFEKALRACTGDLIVLCDQDDIWEVQRVERMAAEFNRRPSLLLMHSDATLVDAEGRPIGQTLFFALDVRPFELCWLHEGAAFYVFLRRNLVTGATAMLRRSLLTFALPLPEGWLHDEWLGAIGATVGGVDVIEAPLINYRQHSGNLIGARRLGIFETIHKALSPRGRTHALRAVKAKSWLDRLDSMVAAGVPIEPQKRLDLVRRLQHQNFRAALPASRLARVLPIWREVCSGNYEQFGRGVRGVVRDLLESA